MSPDPVNDPELDAAIADRLSKLRTRIEAAASSSGRDGADITLLGASKIQAPKVIAVALQNGLRCLGENYVQEAAEKQPALAALLGEPTAPEDKPRWHMIGALQRNKAKLAVSLFDVIQTLDRASIALEVDKRARGIDKCIDAFIQVNLSEEPQKAGISEQALPELLAQCAPLANLRIVGLMTIPAPVSNPAENRPVFARLRTLRDSLHSQSGGESLRELSMGMSRDFEIAIEEGATLVRIGSDLFGPRPEKN
ncbi:MAG: YggS family pyridoxal phosphate-dependent enzyme [Planctomycetes bacterium]|nr:YggS family pyridoxal phosphate-dependent enzyme [Planctomycetota bacterium]